MDRIASDLTTAMKAKEAQRLSTLRMLKTALMNATIDARGRGTELSDDQMVAAVQTEAKRLRESIHEFTNGGRADLTAAAQAELGIVQQYLPEQMSEEEVRNVVISKRETLGASDVGPLIGAVMKELKGRVDGAVVRKVVEEVLGK